ncbi:hypothetical protein ACQP0C_32345 [Nocardia sp. CA-129566]|uniref:hypothetical protein n=1 Tax=Nocardia sp. CA-129566 TaxID=3239976 RepID=UPI003D983DBA
MNRHLTPADVNDLRREVRDEFAEAQTTLAEHGSLLREILDRLPCEQTEYR